MCPLAATVLVSGSRDPGRIRVENTASVTHLARGFVQLEEVLVRVQFVLFFFSCKEVCFLFSGIYSHGLHSADAVCCLWRYQSFVKCFESPVFGE